MEQKMNWLSLAREVLSEKNSLHVDDITEAIIKKGVRTTLSKEEISSKLASALASTVNNKSKEFDRVYHTVKGKKTAKRGFYKLKKKIAKTDEPVNQPAQPEPPLSSQFMGKGGEFAVLSELLFRGFNASIMTVDDGIDIVASKNNLYFHIQVKTSAQKHKSDKLTYTIKNSSFESARGYSTFYVFVFRREYKGFGFKNDFIILPNNMIDHYKAEGIITSATSVSINIYVDEKGEFYLNKTAKLKQYLNNFEQLTK